MKSTGPRLARLAGFPIACVMAAFYLPFLALNLMVLLRIHRRFATKTRAVSPQMQALADHWAKHPMSFIVKTVEQLLFAEMAADDISNALEIGVYNGKTSRSFFLDRRFAAGVEYVFDRLLDYQKQPAIHDALYAADVRDLPFSDGCFDAVICVHSIDDMEFHASDALREMARVTRPGGKVVFSGVTESFVRQNPLIRALLAIGMRDAAAALFRVLHVGTFNAFDEKTWRKVAGDAGLEIDAYRTFIPLRIAWLFELALRPEAILLNLFGFDHWLEPLARTSWFRNALFRAATAMEALGHPSSDGPVEGIHFVASATRLPTDNDKPRSAPFDPAKHLRCLRCGHAPIGDRAAGASRSLLCSQCGADYPVVAGIPMMFCFIRATHDDDSGCRFPRNG